MAKANKTETVKTESVELTEVQIVDLRKAAIDAGLSLSMGEAAAAQMKARAETSEKTLASYFSYLLLKYSKADVQTTKDARKQAVVPALDAHLEADEMSMMARVNAMTDDEMATYGWRRETKMVKGRAAMEIVGYKVSRSWIQYKTNTRTAIINGTARKFADDERRDDSKPVPMARVMELNREATRQRNLDDAIKKHDAVTLARDVLHRLSEPMRDLIAKATKEGDSVAAAKAHNLYAIAVCKFAEKINEALEVRAMKPVDIAALQKIVNHKPLPVVKSEPVKPPRQTKPKVQAA